MEKDGETLKQEGINIAEKNANKRINLWSVSAFNILKQFLETHSEFMAEDVRTFADEIGLENPPSFRAWGAIILKAKKEGLIVPIGYSQVSNPRAHKANASIWRKSDGVK